MEPSHVCRQHKVTVTASAICGDFKRGGLSLSLKSGLGSSISLVVSNAVKGSSPTPAPVGMTKTP